MLRVVQPRPAGRHADLLVLPSDSPLHGLDSAPPPPSSEVFSHELEFEDVTPASSPAYEELPRYERDLEEDDDTPETRRSWMAGLPPPLPEH